MRQEDKKQSQIGGNAENTARIQGKLAFWAGLLLGDFLIVSARRRGEAALPRDRQEVPPTPPR